MNDRSCLALAMLVAASAAHAATVPGPGPTDPRVRVVAYDPDDVVELHGYVGYQIDLQWAPGERFIDLGAGDTGGFDIGAEQNHLFIKPKQPHVHTDITMITTRHAYHFDYRASLPPRRGSPSDIVYAVRFTYPADDASAAAHRADQKQAQARLAARPPVHNADYWYCGDPALKPEAAFDDGLQTHVRFAAGQEIPAIFLKNDDDSESLLNFHVDRDELVIHRVAHRLVLRRGDLVGCIVNRGTMPEGAAATGTASPLVTRVPRSSLGDQP